MARHSEHHLEIIRIIGNYLRERSHYGEGVILEVLGQYMRDSHMSICERWNATDISPAAFAARVRNNVRTAICKSEEIARENNDPMCIINVGVGRYAWGPNSYYVDEATESTKETTEVAEDKKYSRDPEIYSELYYLKWIMIHTKHTRDLMQGFLNKNGYVLAKLDKYVDGEPMLSQVTLEDIEKLETSETKQESFIPSLSNIKEIF